MLKEIETLAQTVTHSFGVAGIAIGIVKDGEIYAQGFGVKDIRTREPVTADSLFHLASISKTFVATAIMQFVEQGKLSLDAPLVNNLPDFVLDDDRFRQISVRQMLSHTSGMPDTDNYGWDKPEYDDAALKRYVRSLAKEKLIAAPGQAFAYSNIAYEVLGQLIAHTSGQSFEGYIADHLLRPLGMNSSTFLKTEVAPDHAVTPHLVLPPTIVSPEYPYNRAHAPSSTLHSSARELCLWALMNLNRGELDGRRVLSTSSYDLLWHPHCPTDPDHPGESAGLSWFLQDYRGHRMIRHDGEDVGFQTDLVLLPEQGLAVTVLTNTIPGPVNALTHAILDLLLGIEPEFPKPPVLLSLASTLAEHGIQAAAEEYSRIQKTQADHYDFGPDQFLDIGYTLLEVRRYAEGSRLVQLGAQLFPDAPELARLLAKFNSQRESK